MPNSRVSISSVTLAHVSVGDLIQIGYLNDSHLSGTGVQSELRTGDVIQCLRNDRNGVLIARADGSRLLVPLERARGLEIFWFPQSAEPGDGTELYSD